MADLTVKELKALEKMANHGEHVKHVAVLALIAEVKRRRSEKMVVVPEDLPGFLQLCQDMDTDGTIEWGVEDENDEDQTGQRDEWRQILVNLQDAVGVI